MKYADDVCPLHSNDGGCPYCCCAGGPQGSTHQATLAEEITAPQNGDHCFLATLGLDGQLRIAILNVEDGIGFIALVEDGLSAPVLQSGRLIPYALGRS